MGVFKPGLLWNPSVTDCYRKLFFWGVTWSLFLPNLLRPAGFACEGTLEVFSLCSEWRQSVKKWDADTRQTARKRI